MGRTSLSPGPRRLPAAKSLHRLTILDGPHPSAVDPSTFGELNFMTSSFGPRHRHALTCKRNRRSQSDSIAWKAMRDFWPKIPAACGKTPTSAGMVCRIHSYCCHVLHLENCATQPHRYRMLMIDSQVCYCSRRSLGMAFETRNRSRRWFDLL